MGTFEPHQDTFPVAAALLRGRGKGTEAARLGHRIGRSTRPLPMRKVAVFDIVPAWTMAARDADCLQPVVAAVQPPTGIAWWEASTPGLGGCGALCHSPEPGRLDIEHVELEPEGELRTVLLFGTRLPGGHQPLGKDALRRLARGALRSTERGKRRADEWLAGHFRFSRYPGTPDPAPETDALEQQQCLQLLADLVVLAMVEASVIQPVATVNLG